MDTEELIIAVLKHAETLELESNSSVSLYTCSMNQSSIFGEIVETGELCVLASSVEVATVLFFLIQGLFDRKHNPDYFISVIHEGLDLLRSGELQIDGIDDDDITPELAFCLWVHLFQGQVMSHSVRQPIVIRPLPDSMIALTPSTCDIWTIPRIRRQYI